MTRVSGHARRRVRRPARPPSPTVSSASARGTLSLPFIPSCLPTTARLCGTEIILSQWILKSTPGAVITMLIPPDRGSEPMQGHADAGSVHVATERH